MRSPSAFAGRAEALGLGTSAALPTPPGLYVVLYTKPLGGMVAQGLKYPIFKDSGSKNHTINGFWHLGPESLNIGYLDPLGSIAYVGVSQNHLHRPDRKDMTVRVQVATFETRGYLPIVITGIPIPNI